MKQDYNFTDLIEKSKKPFEICPFYDKEADFWDVLFVRQTYFEHRINCRITVYLSDDGKNRLVGVCLKGIKSYIKYYPLIKLIFKDMDFGSFLQFISAQSKDIDVKTYTGLKEKGNKLKKPALSF